ncbi:ATP-binding protein [Ottowia pentelensis]
MGRPGGGESLGSQGLAVAEIQRNIAELDQLVDEILLASRLEAPQTDLGTLELIDLAGLAAEEAARVDAELSLAPGTGEVLVRGVSKLLRRAVRNLLENAARHGRRAGQQLAVGVTLSVADAQAVLQVDDHGPGVPPEQRERIFEPFTACPAPASARAAWAWAWRWCARSPSAMAAACAAASTPAAARASPCACRWPIPVEH